MNLIETITEWATTQGLTLAALVLRAVITAAIGLLVIHIINKIINTALERSKLDRAAHNLIKTLAKTLLYLLLILIVASGLGIDVTGVVALASVATLAVSLSLQDLLSNVVGGITLLYTDPFNSGDYVEVGGQSGTVKEVGMTYTKLITPDNKVVFIPNKAVVSAEIVNYSTTGTRRVTIDIAASYDCEPQKVIDALLSCADGAYILSDPEKPYAVLTSYGESVINYQLRYCVNSSDYWTSCFEINQKIPVAFEAAGVEMSYPHLNVHLDK